MNLCNTQGISVFILLFVGVIFMSCIRSKPEEKNLLRESLEVAFEGDASIEVGSPYVGLEFHHSSPMPQRVSFYYPVANSIDMSTDYWTRDETHAMMAALKIGNGEFEWIGLEAYQTVQTPYFVQFFNSNGNRDVQINYEFLQNNPAFRVSYIITNTSAAKQVFDVYTHLQAALKTSHTYALKNEAWSTYFEEGSSLVINYEEDEVSRAKLVLTNSGLEPASFSSQSGVKAEQYSAQGAWWEEVDTDLHKELLAKNAPGSAAFRYRYVQELAPGEQMEIVQVIASTDAENMAAFIQELQENAQEEVTAFENKVLSYVQENTFVTGDSVLDHSVHWANAILEVNRHYIDGSVQPMPCPAQYNFYFTHDVLLTDLAAVNFDLNRVKNDLEFIVSHADENYVIPHAYYWKDDHFETELAPTDNWNHFWFVIASASYLRHSGNTTFLDRLYPYLAKSVHDFSTHNKNGIIYSYRPDWWDIARNFGPRSYTTILASKALREFQYISTELGKNEDELIQREAEIKQMHTALNDELWDEQQEYLTNYFEDESQDEHYYIGSLLASHYGLLSNERSRQLTATAAKVLVDPNIGVYTVYPMDFQNLIEYLKLSGNEAGDPHYYINGGVWPHGNAWYLLSMIEAGDRAGAYEFIKNNMTVKGVMDSPNGYPAMYEYRVSNKNDPKVYGKIDKPQFTWAAGWYVYGLYNLFGIRETEWNIRFSPYLMEGQKEVRFDLTHSGQKREVTISGIGKNIEVLELEGDKINSLVLPDRLDVSIKKVNIVMTDGIQKEPFLTALSGKLKEISFNKNESSLYLEVASFTGHELKAELISASSPSQVFQNGRLLSSDSWVSMQDENGAFLTSLTFIQQEKQDEVKIVF